MQEHGVTRRRALGLGSGVLAAAIAGCEGLSANERATPREPNLDNLETLSVFVSGAVDLEVPDGLTTVEERADAELLVLSADTDVGAAQAIDWLEDGKSVALLGDGSRRGG